MNNAFAEPQTMLLLGGNSDIGVAIVRELLSPATRTVVLACRDIAKGEQITCEYGGLNLSGRLRCRCGSPKCRGVITGEDTLRLWKEWDDIVRDSLNAAPKVPQPLLGYARDPQQFWRWVQGTEQVPSHREYHSGGEASADDVSERPWARPRRVSA